MLGTEPDVLPGGGGDCYRFTTFSAREKRYHVWLQRTLRSRLVFCVMPGIAQGAHRGRPVAAAPCTPGLRPAKSPLRGAFDFSLQASGRAEAASVQNTALSPHPCGLPQPSGNVSAILRPPAPAVSVAPDPVVIWGCRPGQAQPPPGTKAAPRPLSLPGGAALAGPTVMVNLVIYKWLCRPGKRSATRQKLA
ncbi:Uncharacterised protein [Klebsiella pneumoniae]|nr:Uncharacterised protein [Klebsiella pneumoniae]